MQYDPLLPVLSTTYNESDYRAYLRMVQVIKVIILMRIIEWKKAYRPERKIQKGLILDVTA